MAAVPSKSLRAVSSNAVSMPNNINKMGISNHRTQKKTAEKAIIVIKPVESSSLSFPFSLRER